MKALVEVSNATILTPTGRPLFDGLNLRLARERVALIGRNGVGKSTLLAVLAGATEVQTGRVTTSSKPHFVPQSIAVRTPASASLPVGVGVGVMPAPTAGSLAPEARTRAVSHGERRKLALADARVSGAEILLLDEPTEDLDDAAVSWLRSWLKEWPGSAVVASHDRRLLDDFRHFLIVSESGCRYFCGSLAELDVEVEHEHQANQERYARNLHRLAAHEERTVHIARRKARKKRYGRCSELDRATPRARLNQKRDDAQVSHGRLTKVREARLDALRRWSKSTRRALGVNLSLELPVPSLPEATNDVLVLRDVSFRVEERNLIAPLDLRLARQRLAVVGPNGAGKTTLLEILSGRRTPSTGTIIRDLPRIGIIEQGAVDWTLDDTLLDLLRLQASTNAAEDLATILMAHKFPFALAERPLRSLSPGERARAALICLFRRAPAVELLILDEPTYSLDLVGQRAMTTALRAWPGGLVVASHDRAFLSAIGTDILIELGPARSEREEDEKASAKRPLAVYACVDDNRQTRYAR